MPSANFAVFVIGTGLFAGCQTRYTSACHFIVDCFGIALIRRKIVTAQIGLVCVLFTDTFSCITVIDVTFKPGGVVATIAGARKATVTVSGLTIGHFLPRCEFR